MAERALTTAVIVWTMLSLMGVQAWIPSSRLQSSPSSSSFSSLARPLAPSSRLVLQLSSWDDYYNNLNNMNNNNNDDDDDDAQDPEGADLAAAFFRMAEQKGIGLSADDLIEDDDEDEDDEWDNNSNAGYYSNYYQEEDEEEEEDEPEMNIPQGAMNAFLGYETNPGVGDRLAGNVSLTNDQLYSEVRERVLDTAGGFVDYVQGARNVDEDDDDEDYDEDEWGAEQWGGPPVYQPPLTIPDPEMTAGEVVEAVLEAFRHHNDPTPHRGMEIFLGFSSPSSSAYQNMLAGGAGSLTPAEYTEFLQEQSEYQILFDPHREKASIEKADYALDGKKAFFTARLASGNNNVVSVNFILSTTGVTEEACWLIDSMLIRPQSMQRRRRR